MNNTISKFELSGKVYTYWNLFSLSKRYFALNILCRVTMIGITVEIIVCLSLH